MKFGILIVSDRCSSGQSVDSAGHKLKEAISKKFQSSEHRSTIVPDDKDKIVEVLKDWSTSCNIIFTVGGTGFSPRDVTPEATRMVIEKEAPGLAYAMISRSLQVTETAMLSRAVSGIRGNCLIVNMPGSAKAAVECFDFIKEALPHALSVLANDVEKVTKDHVKIQGTVCTSHTGCIKTESKVRLGNVASRHRRSPYPMIEVSKAHQILQQKINTIDDNEHIPFEESMNRVFAKDVIAKENIPSFRASMKDGYAVRSLDGTMDRVVIEAAAAGDKPRDGVLREGEAIRISTGGVVPDGADAVVMVEDTEVLETTYDGLREVKIKVNVEPKIGQDIRDIGSDIAIGTRVLSSKTIISPASVGVLAMLGETEVCVFRQPSIAVLSTGNEVRNPRDQLEPGQIRDCNRYTLINMLKKYGFPANDYGFVRDDPNSVKNALDKAFQKNDVVITSGGVSMGEFDIIKQILIEDFAAVVHFARVNMKPGKPTTFATLTYNGKQKIFFGLPGNPVSCCVTCILFVIPSLKHMINLGYRQFPTISTKGKKLPNLDGRPEYHRVSLTFTSDGVTYESTGNQISSRLNSLVGADGLTVITSSDREPSRTILFDIN